MNRESLNHLIAGELKARAEQVDAAVQLLNEGNTVPFIARYRKEVTGAAWTIRSCVRWKRAWVTCASWTSDVRVF